MPGNYETRGDTSPITLDGAPGDAMGYVAAILSAQTTLLNVTKTRL